MRATNWRRKKAEPNGKGGEKPQKQERTEKEGKRKNSLTQNLRLFLVLVFQVGLCYLSLGSDFLRGYSDTIYK